MKIALVGDVGFFGRFSSLDKIKEYLKPVRELLQDYDYIIANLEAPFIISNYKKYSYKSVHLGADPSAVTILKYLGVNVVNLSNNHIYDYGKRGVDLTIKVLNENNISYFGLDKDCLIKDKENKIALHGYCCYSSNGYKLGSVLTPLSKKTVESKLEYYKKRNYINILSCHFGQEHIEYPSIEHVSFFRSLSNKYDFILHGHHPHVIQGSEKINNSYLYYSFGNFMFDDLLNLDPNVRVRYLDIHKKSLIVELNIINNKVSDEKVHSILWGVDKVIVNNIQLQNHIQNISNLLSLPLAKYKELRTSKLTVNLERVLRPRDRKYYFRRLNIRSFFILKNGLINKWKYKKSICGKN